MTRLVYSCGVRALEGLGALALLALMGVVLVDVVGRYIWNSPLAWGTEMLEVSLAVSIFLMFPILILKRGHVTVDLISLPTMVRVQHFLSDLIGAVLFGTVAWSLGRQTVRVAEFNETTPVLHFPLSIALGFLAVLAGLTALAAFASAVQGSMYWLVGRTQAAKRGAQPPNAPEEELA